MQPRQESRIESLEKRASTIEATLIELSNDTAEELKSIRQDIRSLNQDMLASFQQVEATMVTKEDLSNLRDEIKADMTAMETRLIDTMKQLFSQKQSE